jgi:hypothetical protein
MQNTLQKNEVIDLRSQMIHATQCQEKFVKESQKKTKIKNIKRKQCVKTSGMHSIQTTKGLLIITKHLEIILLGVVL